MRPSNWAQRRVVAVSLFFAVVGLTACAGDQQEIAEPTTSAAAPTSSTADETTTEKTTTSEATTTARKGPDCSTAGLQKNPDFYDMEFTVCEGGFGYAMVPQSDVSAFVQWNGTTWEGVESDGMITEGMGGPCWNQATLDKLGVPKSVQESVWVCDEYAAAESKAPATQSAAPGGGGSYFQNGIIMSAGLGEASEDASFPACDGRNILILDSVIDHGNDGGAMNDIAQQVLMQHPSGRPVRFTVPGQCPSLRAQLDGNNIYPVYIDFGADTSAMCQAKATYGGNGRVLSNRAEFVDPC